MKKLNYQSFIRMILQLRFLDLLITIINQPWLLQKQSEGCNFIKKDTLTQVFSCEFCDIFKNNFFKNNSGGLLLLLEVNISSNSFCAVKIQFPFIDTLVRVSLFTITLMDYRLCFRVQHPMIFQDHLTPFRVYAVIFVI